MKKIVGSVLIFTMIITFSCEPRPYGGTFNIEIMIPLNLS